MIERDRPDGEGGAAALRARLRAAFSTWPDRPGWAFAGAQLLCLLPVLGALGWAGGFIAWRPALGAQTWMLLAIALVFPALAEETVFRIALVPRAAPLSDRRKRAGLALLLFVAWHPIQAQLYRVPWHEQAGSPWFLAAVASLGLATNRIWLRTGSVWPCVAVHWIPVALWKALFGAPLFFPHP